MFDLRMVVPNEVASILAQSLHALSGVAPRLAPFEIAAAAPRVELRLELANEPAGDFGLLLARALEECDATRAPIRTRHGTQGWRWGFAGWFKGHRISERLKIRPPWLEATPGGGREVLIDPGLSFEAAGHPNTRLRMSLLDTVLARLPGGKLLDLSAGIGMLATAAGCFGWQVIAVEPDIRLLEQARRNVRLNEVESAVTLIDAEPTLAEPFDLVVSTLTLREAQQRAPALTLRSRALLLLVGFQASERAELRALFPKWRPLASAEYLGYGAELLARPSRRKGGESDGSLGSLV